MELLRVEDLNKYFYVSAGVVHAVDGVSFSLDEGKTLGVVGESGCGKSTLGKTVLRLIEPTAGRIYFRGEEITVLTKAAFKSLRQDMQMIFQDPFSSLDPRMNITELIEEPLRIFGIGDRQQRKERVSALMDTVGIAKRLATSYPHELDGGRRQRIGIARALALEPSLIVCDEPVSALDVSIQSQVLNLLQDLQRDRNLTYMFITHDLSVVRHISDEIVVMYLGQIVERCEARELFVRTLHPYTQALLSAIPVPRLDNRREKMILKGEISSPINPKKQCRFAPRCPLATEDCFHTEPVLREITPGHACACLRVEP